MVENKFFVNLTDDQHAFFGGLKSSAGEVAVCGGPSPFSLSLHRRDWWATIVFFGSNDEIIHPNYVFLIHLGLSFQSLEYLLCADWWAGDTVLNKKENQFNQSYSKQDCCIAFYRGTIFCESMEKYGVGRGELC